MPWMQRLLIPIFDPAVREWATEARLLRWLTFLWLFVGLAVLVSASYPMANADFGDGFYYLKRQLIWVIVGLIGFNILVYSPLRYIQGIADWFVLILLTLILLTLVPGLGTTVNGATRWLKVGPIPIQPSELIKPFLILQAARIFGQWNRLRWGTRAIWLVIFALMLFGILLQPNLSTTALCGISLWAIALASGLRLKYLGMTAGSGVLLAILSMTFREYQRRRVLAFLNPWKDRYGDGYQLIQSLLAVGSGGSTGTGFGLSQQKLLYLPIQFTDFIFAVFAEEFGFIGSALLLLMLVTYATLALMVAFKARQRVHQLVAIGVMVVMVGQSLLNIGVATGALPTPGLPFPLFSYGGSSMIASLMCAGMLIRVARENAQAEVVAIGDRPSRRPRRSRRSSTASKI
ncbi:MAG: FtsW/RodA/SpoVE family cell cycle protein [Cyanobacteria bacterium J007]|nr:MAG: FtsW/RodA/SpoVE family cell cycle protein [Cyanobacteria bacterium J007]